MRPGDEVGIQHIECITQSIFNIFRQFPYIRVVRRYKLRRQSLLFEDSFLFMFNHIIDFLAAGDIGVLFVKPTSVEGHRPFNSCLLGDLAFEAGGDLVLIQTSLLLLCKSSCSEANYSGTSI